MDKDNLKTIKYQILNLLFEEKYKKRNHFNLDFLYRVLTEYSKFDIDFALWYLKEKKFIDNCQITTIGVDEILCWKN